MNRVSAVIVTYNRKEMLLKCLQALLGQQEACDILVVDNASTDGTREFVTSLTDPRIHYRNTYENLGGAGGFNRGVRWAVEAGYDYVWLMDDDSIPEPDALAMLLEADSRLSGVYGWLSSRAFWIDGSICRMNVQRSSPYRDIKHFDESQVPAQMASFVSLFLSSEKVRQYGLPIGEFFIWGDDWEYTRRISRKEACYVIPSSKVTHAMKNPNVVNIARDSSARLDRYRYAYRNDVYLYRREGVRGWLWILLKDCWHSTQVLTAGCEKKGSRLSILWKGFRAGLTFLPEIEYLP